MRVGWIIGLTAVCILGVAWRQGASPAVADNQLVTAASAVLPVGFGGEDKHAYVGSKKCKMCHSTQHKSWSKTKMGQAFETLKAGNKAEAKKKHGLDPTKDYTKDETCLKCHVTGFGAKGGYAIPAGDDKKAAKKAKALEGVGCESCHGAGAAYVKLHKEIQKSKRTYTQDEMIAVGAVLPTKEVCVKCHNDTGPTFDKSKPFDFDTAKAKDAHEHKELKQRG